MEFKRKRIRGRDQKTYREWYDESRQYQIRWRSMWEGIQVIPAYYALVRCLAGENVIWDFVGRMGPYKTYKKALEEAERNRKVWERFLEIANGERKGRMDRVRALDLRTRHAGRRILGSLPLWVRDAAEPRALRLLFPDPSNDDPTETCSTTETSSSSIESTSEIDPMPGPVLSVAAQEPSETPVSESTKSAQKSPARSVKAREKAPKKSARKRSAKQRDTGEAA